MFRFEVYYSSFNSDQRVHHSLEIGLPMQRKHTINSEGPSSSWIGRRALSTETECDLS